MNDSAVNKIDIAGTGISDITLNETIALFDQWIRQGLKKRIAVTPVNCVVWAGNDPSLKKIYNEADLTLCDGVPLIWASRFVGNGSLRSRVTGLDLLPAFTLHCFNEQYPMFFMGSSDQTNQKLREKLEKEYPGIRIAGMYSPPYMPKFSEQENERIIHMINRTKPAIVWVSLTAPKQDFWIYEHFEKLEANIVIGIGGALDVMAGNIKRAPVWMQRNGLEWLFRFLNEPRRLFKRYFIEAPGIIPLLVKQKRAQRAKKTGY